MPQPCGLGQYYKTFLHLHISSDHTQLYPVIAKIIYHKKKEVKKYNLSFPVSPSLKNKTTQDHYSVICTGKISVGT